MARAKQSEAGLLKEIRTPDRIALTYAYDSKALLNSISCANTFKLDFDYDLKGRLTSLAQVPVNKAGVTMQGINRYDFK